MQLVHKNHYNSESAEEGQVPEKAKGGNQQEARLICSLGWSIFRLKIVF